MSSTLKPHVTTNCARCHRRLEAGDVALACRSCPRVYHHDCFIPGARCVDCSGAVEFRKAAPRCTRARCSRSPSRMGWAFLGRGSRSLCHEHAADLRTTEAYSLLAALAFMAVYFAVRAGSDLDRVLHTALSLEVLGGVGGLFLLVAAAFGVDAWRIRRADPFTV